ncbi:hypothetical protein HAX54_026642 [Datura stramonium]|uniref:Uncharacterized protein n=1 Tax=Datura stramonium TaxID=4076 RepID=A0ABS8Y9R4_DATST|nr:hypothetical protein [Datura stramonium]
MDLEHRVYELEGIGAREALAALKANMRKVMTDVQQLQPDLRIFDAPLPKNKALKDERVETDEELEEEHLAKEIDEERKVKMATQSSMDDVIAWKIGTSPSSRAPAREDVGTTNTTTTTQSEEAEDYQSISGRFYILFYLFFYALRTMCYTP